MVAVATVMKDKKAEYVRYVATKLDGDILHLVKAAAAMERKNVQDWLSDIANAAAAERLNVPPVKRKPPKPRD